jgi:indole-3-glycerol phosphate synthase
MAESTVQTETILDQLVAGKREGLAARLASESLSAVRERALSRPAPLPLAPVLCGPEVRLIAEIKKASPAAGLLEAEFDPVTRAAAYVKGGAAAISILTEERRFLGSLDHLSAVRTALDIGGGRHTPLLRKDFLFDPYHLFEARARGADAVLLIVAVLQQSALESLLALARDLGLSALVEVHDDEQLDRALSAGADLIGINNRDLHTFQTSLDVTERLCTRIPDGPVVVSESGIHSTQDITRLAQSGVDAILVGEALMRSGRIVESVQEFSNIRRPVESHVRARDERR